MKKELAIFFTAVCFYTRIPCPPSLQHQNKTYLNSSIKYFPLIGWIVGLFAAIILSVSNVLFGLSLAVLFSMLSSVFLTGAFHEDGLADVCDGFGGGWNKEKILDIMKDSRVGAYGVLGLIFMLATKFISIHQLLLKPLAATGFLTTVLLFITAHALSRFAAATIIFSHPYVRATESKVKPATEQTNKINLLVAAMFAVIPLIALVVLTAMPQLLFIFLPLYLTKKYFGWYFTKWIGGYTGDCLGAVQQVSEVVIYLSFIVLWKFT